MGLFDFALKKKEEEKKQPLGSSFGGGWGLSDLVNEQKKKELSPSITSNIGAGAGVKTEGNIGQFDFALKVDPESIKQKEQALVKVEETFSTLDKSIETNYKRYQELGTQLDDLEVELQEAPEELQWNLSLKYENLLNEHNKLVDQLQTDTQQQKKVYADYNTIRDSYEKDLEIYNRKVEAQNKQVQQQHQDYLDTSRLGGSMARGEELPKTHERQLKDKFTTSPEKATVGGIVGISEPLDLSQVSDPVKRVIQAIGGAQGLRITEPELYKQSMEIKNEIYKYADPLERIAKAHEMMTGEPMEEALKELQEYEPPKPENEFKPTWLKWRGDDPAVYGNSVFGSIQLSPKRLPEKFDKALGLVSQASQFTTSEQAGHLLRSAATGVVIGNLALNIAKVSFKAAPEIWDKIKNKDIIKHYSRDEILKIWDKVDRGIANKTEEALIKSIAKEDSVINAIKQGFDVKQTVPRFAPSGGTTLYSGLPADEIAKAIVETGKVTADVIKGLDPVKVSQVTQQLLNTAPALASEFLKAVEKPEVAEEAISEIPEELKPLAEESIKYDNPKEFIGDKIFDKNLTGRESKALQENFSGESEAERLESFYIQAKREAIAKEEVSLPQKAPEQPISEGEKGDLIKEARKSKNVEEFIEKLKEPVRPIRETKIGEIVVIQSDTYGKKTAEDFNMGVPTQGEIVKINPKTVSVKVGENVYKYPETAKVSKFDLKEFVGYEKEDIIKFYNQATPTTSQSSEAPEKPVAPPPKPVEAEAQQLRPKPIKTQIREVTGQTPPPKIEIRERDILKYVLRGEQRVARDIFNKGKEEGIFQANEKFENRLQRIQERKDIKELRQEIREQEKQDKIAALKKSNNPSNIVDKKSDALIYSGQKNNDNPITIQENKILGYVLKGEERAARQAFSEGKKEGIFQQKEHFEDVIARAKERKAKSQEINKIKDIVRNTNLKELRPERKANIEKIINDLDLSRMTGKTQAKLTSRLDYVRENPDNQIPIERLDELARLNKKPIADLTADEIKNIKDAILHEIHLNKLKNKLEFGREIKDANEVLKTARKNVLKGGKGLKDDPGAIIDSGETEHKSLWQRIKQIWGIDSLNTETICEELDHGDHGEIMKYIYSGIDKGVTDKLKVMQDADDWFTKELEGIDISKWSKSFQQKKSSIDFQTIKLSGGKSIDGKGLLPKKIKITKGERVSFLLHNQNDKNLAHLTGGGFRFSDKPSTKYSLTEENIKQIIDSATPEEKKIAEVISKFFNEYMKPKINDASMKLNGFEVATEENYFPIRTLELDRQRDALKAKRTFHHKTLEGMGIFKERTNATNALIIEDAFNVVVKHLEQTSSYIGLAKPLRYARFIVEDTELQENVMKNHGKEYIDSLKDYLKRIEDDSTNVENTDKLTMELINKLDVAILGINPFVALKQPISYIAASTEMDSKYLVRGLEQETNIEEIKRYSPQLRQRFEGSPTRELGEISNIGKTKHFFLHQSPVSSKLLAAISKMDLMTIGKIWNSVKLEISEKYPNLSGDEYYQKVTERAEEVVRRTQPTWHIKDRSAIGRSKSLMFRLLTKYTSQRNKNVNIAKRLVMRYNRSGKTAKDKVDLANGLSKIFIISSIFAAAVNELRNKVYGKKGRGIWGFALDVIGTALGSFYFLGDAFSSLISKIQKGTYAGFDSMGNIVEDWVNDTISGIAEVSKAVEELQTKEKYKSGTKKGEEKYKTTALRALDKIASSVLTIRGVPYDNVKRLVEGTSKMVGDKKETETKTTSKSPTFPTIQRPTSPMPGAVKPSVTPPGGKPPGTIQRPAGKPPGF